MTRVRVGDMVRIGNPAAGPTRWAKVVEVRGPDGSPPYLVELGNGRVETVVPEGQAFVYTPGMARRDEEERERGHRAWLERYRTDPGPAEEA